MITTELLLNYAKLSNAFLPCFFKKKNAPRTQRKNSETCLYFHLSSLCVIKVERKGRMIDELHKVIACLMGFNLEMIQQQIDLETVLKHSMRRQHCTPCAPD